MQTIKDQKIQAIFAKYGFNLSDQTPEPYLNLASSGTINRVEVKNIFEGRPPWIFDRKDVETLKIEELKEIVERYTKKVFPKGLSYAFYKSFLNYEFNITKVLKRDMDILANYFKTSNEMTATMWLGFIPQVQNEVYNRDIKKAENYLDQAWKNMQEFRYKKI